MVRQKRKRYTPGSLSRRRHRPYWPLGNALAITLFCISTLASALPPAAEAQPPNDIPAREISAEDLSALRELAESAPVLSEVTTEPRATEEPDYRHRLLLDRIPGLPGEIQFLDSVPDDTTVRALLTLDGKLLALPLKRDKQTSHYLASFPTPYRSLDYQFQLLTAKGANLSVIFRATPQCADPVEKEERFTGELDLVKQIRLLRNDTALLTATIRQVEVILGK